MSDMPNNEVLKFTGQPENDKNSHSNPVNGIDGSSALKLEPDFLDDRETEKDRNAQIGEIREFIKPVETQNILPFTNTDAGVQRAPRGVVGPVGNQGRETSGGDRTGGGKKKGLGFRITAGAMAVVAGFGIAYGVFKDQINSFFGGSVDPNGLPPGQTVGASGEMPSQSENIESPTPSAEVTPEITQSPSPEPTETPIVLDEFGFSEERKAELNQQFQDFLNKQGEFTPEKMSSIMMEIDSGLDVNEIGLGIVDVQPKIQGYFFDYFDKDGRIFLFLGFDGKDGNRFITPVEIPIYFQEGVDPAPFFIDKLGRNYIGSFDSASRETKDYDSKEDLMPLLNDLKGNVIVLTMNIQQYNKSEFEGLDSKAYQVAVNYLDEINPKVALSFGLFQMIPSNGIEYDNSKKIEGDSGTILNIDNINEIYNIDISKIPIVRNICFFK